MHDEVAVESAFGPGAFRIERVTRAEAATQPVVLPIDPRKRALSETLLQWQALAREAPPMLAPEFMLLTARLLGNAQVILVGARRGDKLAAALPLIRDGRTLRALRSDHSPRIDVVGEAASVATLWRAIRQAGGWDVLEMRGVPADSPLVQTIPALAIEDRCRVRVRETSRAPWFLVEGIEQRIHRRFRGDMRRLERQMGGIELERVTGFDREALADMLRLEAAAWKGAAGTAIACDAALSHFYNAIARILAPRGALSIAFLRAGGKRIAAQLVLEDASTLYLMKVGYDPAFAHFGPGQLLVRETAADAARRGLERYDLLGKDTAWKMKWTSQVRAHVEIVVYAPSVLGRTRHRLREVARPLLGRAWRAFRGSPVARNSGR
jgi:CelD/BcsL family acetyltransferase involved in cellulose biosynthesis